ncbi:MAG: hypothetical protein LBR72_07880 [Oscillospiraceae bacterium]|jgi:ribosomal protein L7Ae-like RNA K-turn-binding protein|nr:hypothetical protein [Oscillospiraceae bacterium]
MNPQNLRTLGLAYRAGKVVWGLDAVAGAKGQAAVFLLANDAGNAARREAERLSAMTGTLLKILPVDKAGLGAALGKPPCAVAAVTDQGFARSILTLPDIGGNPPVS